MEKPCFGRPVGREKSHHSKILAGLLMIRTAGIPDWMLVALIAGGVLLLALWLRKKAGGAPPLPGGGPVPR